MIPPVILATPAYQFFNSVRQEQTENPKMTEVHVELLKECFVRFWRSKMPRSGILFTTFNDNHGLFIIARINQNYSCMTKWTSVTNTIARLSLQLLYFVKFTFIVFYYQQVLFTHWLAPSYAVIFYTPFYVQHLSIHMSYFTNNYHINETDAHWRICV